MARPCVGVRSPLGQKHGICCTLLPPHHHRSLPETLLQLCFPEGSREPRKDAPWGSGLGESLLEERLYKAIVGNLPGAGPCSWHASDPGAWLPALAWTGKRGQQLATQALSWLGTMCQDDRGPSGALRERTEGTTSSSVPGRQLCTATGAGWHGLRSPSPLHSTPAGSPQCLWGPPFPDHRWLDGCPTKESAR